MNLNDRSIITINFVIVQKIDENFEKSFDLKTKILKKLDNLY